MISVVAGVLLAACAASANPVAHFETSEGSFTAEIYLDRVPRTASNFIDLAQTGFYDQLTFHRVIDGFMNQFGCPYSKDPTSSKAGTGGPPDGSFVNLLSGETETRSNGGNIVDEHTSKDSNIPGSLSMANTGQPNSGGSQFFLNVADNSNLDWFSGGSSKHPVFGQILTGMDVVTKISKVKTSGDKPLVPIVMNGISISGLCDAKTYEGCSEKEEKYLKAKAGLGSADIKAEVQRLAGMKANKMAKTQAAWISQRINLLNNLAKVKEEL